MDIREETLANQVVRIVLSGRMDIAGVGQIEKQFAEMTAAPRTAIIVDMTEVPYMSSIGIRALLMNAKAVSRRNGKLVLMGPQPNVKMVLETSGIDKIIAIHSALDAALAAVAP